MTASDDTPTRDYELRAEVAHSARRTAEWDAQESRRLYALARDDLAEMQRVLMRERSLRTL
ncbi:hypothetical protein, partial [Streptococcus pneumoniae]